MKNARPTRLRDGESTNPPTRPPQDGRALAAWFAEGVRAELIELEKHGGSQNYEVLSGIIISARGSDEAVYRFLLADGTRLPEDATGRLKTSSEEYAATVVGQQADRVDILLKGLSRSPSSIPRGLLIIDDTALLRKLAEVLEGVVSKNQLLGPLTTTVFHPSRARIGSVGLPAKLEYAEMEDHQRQAIERACGSSLTYIWGPPGTGKTYVIARLVAALVDQGERVLVSSHTNAALDQALYMTVSPDEANPGPLAEHPLTLDGKILRLGITTENKIPDTVRLDNILEKRARALTDEITRLEGEVKRLRLQRTQAEAVIDQWNGLSALLEQLRRAEHSLSSAEGALTVADSASLANEATLRVRQAALEAARRAWFWRAVRTERATRAVQAAEQDLRQAQHESQAAREARESAAHTIDEVKSLLAQQKGICSRLPAREMIQKEVAELNMRLAAIEERLRHTRDKLAQLEKKIIREARVIFCTLTKNYTGDTLDGQAFDAVIVDEISMALPPLILLAVNRASRRVILVGDFCQLSPIVRSDTPISNERLGKDMFELAGVASVKQKIMDYCTLKRLDLQQRMLPKIADVARHLVYRRVGGLRDHRKVVKRQEELQCQPVEWMNHLPSTPLVIVDTADLHCWSGKQPGSLSRFNFYSAVLAIELAAMAARNLSRHDDEQRRPIGIITPYVAQRQLLQRLLSDMELRPWVTAGTIPTLQGQEAELIIFDSVLDEPHWGARLCNPRDADDVKRDLNVAVTRAKDKFVFIGSSEWLNKHAKPPSALGLLWDYLKNEADLVAAGDVVDPLVFNRSETLFDESVGWTNPKSGDDFTFQLLDEQSFFRHFTTDIRGASDSIFALAAYFGEYRWPKIQPLLSTALARGVKVTIVTPPSKEAPNPSLVEKVMSNLRRLGAVVVTAAGLHGKDVIIDERIVYTGSMNWASHRGRTEVSHRIHAPDYAKRCFEMMQAKLIRQAIISPDGTPRTCPNCSRPVQIVNQRRQPNQWDKNPLKVVCPKDKECARGYYVALDERAPFTEWPRCQKDGRTKYRCVRRGRGKVWQCPKHPKQCPTHKVVPGDPA